MGAGARSGRQATEARADGVVCFAGVDWWYHNRGHSECQILRRLAARCPVLWINSIGMRAPRPGGTELAWHRYGRKLRSTLKGLRRDASGMWIYSPVFVPRYTPRMLAVNGLLLGAQLRLLQRRLAVRRPSVWVTVPSAAPAVVGRRWKRIVFNRSDDFSQFPEVDTELIRGLEASLLDAADHVLYVNEPLFERERASVREAHLIQHGVDFEHFAGARPEAHRPPPDPPEALAGLPRPLVGFYGALDEYTVDLDLLIGSARRIRNGTLLVIGPRAMEIGRLLREPNVRYLGPLPYDEIPRYAAQFDVGLMPWLRNAWIQACNPIKLKEYLALGFPVVSMRFPMLRRYEALVHPADDHAGFLRALDRALAEGDSGMAEARRESVREDSWEAEASRVARLLGIDQG